MPRKDSKKNVKESGKTSAPKNSEVQGKVDKKRTLKRTDISDRRIRRIVLAACPPLRFRGDSDEDLRISSDAISNIKVQAARFLKVLAEEVNKKLTDSKKKTITHQMIVDILEGPTGRTRLSTFGMGHQNLMPQPNHFHSSRSAHQNRKSTVLPRSGVLRIFKKGYDFVITDEAKTSIVEAVAAYISKIGNGAGYVMQAAKRHTIQECDVSAVMSINYSC